MTYLLLLYVLGLSLTCDMFNKITTPKSPLRTLLINQNNLQNFGIGIWTRFNPSIAPFDKELDTVEKMLIFYQSDKTQSEYYTVYSVKFDQVSGTMYHELYLYIGDSFQIFSMPLEATAIHMRWVYLYVCRNIILSRYSIFTYYSNDREYTQMGSGINAIWKQSTPYFFQIGQSAEFSNQFAPTINYKLSVFRGQISDIYFQNEVGTYCENIEEFLLFLDSLICNFPEPCPQRKIVSVMTPVTSFDGHGFLLKKLEMKQTRYLISGWVKAQSLDDEIDYAALVMRVTTRPNHDQNKKQGDRVFYYQYFQNLQPDLNGFYFSTYSLNPDFNKDDYSSTPADEWSERDSFYELALCSWHFFSFQFGLSDPAMNTKLEVFYSYQQITKTKYFTSRKQLDNQDFYFYIGGDKFTQNNQFKGQMANVQLEYCFSVDLTPTIPCHYSCNSCLGPTAQSCNLCANPAATDRELVSSTGECQCKPDYFDRVGEPICQDSKTVFDFVLFEEIELISNCNYGDFSVGGEFCMPCPAQPQAEGFYCADCWMNPRTWYLRPVCTFDFLVESPSSQSAFVKIPKSKKDIQAFFLDFNNRKLILCEGCFYDSKQDNKLACKPCYKLDLNGQCQLALPNCKDCSAQTDLCTACHDRHILVAGHCINCPANCLECYFDGDLSRPMCVLCEQRYGISEGDCRQCGQYCGLCERQQLRQQSIMKCYGCLDNYEYFLTLDGESCRPNVIPNCLIAAQKAAGNPLTITSIDREFSPVSESLSLTFCMRCKPGFMNNHLIEACVPPASFDETIRTLADTVYLGKNSNPSRNQVCQKNCHKCMYLNGTPFCLECDFGYYSDKWVGVCNSCPKNLHCRSCIHSNDKYKDEWKWEIRADYQFNIGQGFGIPNYLLTVESPERVQNSVKCTSCKNGYIFYQGRCVATCHSSCKTCVVENFRSKCIECKSSKQGQLQSIENDKCIPCPQNCSVCKTRTQDEINQLNLYFDLSATAYAEYSAYCLKPFDIPEIYYNWELTSFTECLLLKKPCIKSAKVAFKAYCDDQMFESAKLASLNTEAFGKESLKLSDLFTIHGNPSFPQIENSEFYLIMNQKQLNQIQITITLIYDEAGACRLTPFSSVTTILKNHIFTNQLVELELVGTKEKVLYISSNLSFRNFDLVRIKNMNINVLDSAKILFTTLSHQTVAFESVKLTNNKSPAQFLKFHFVNIAKLHLENFEFTFLRIENAREVFEYEWNANFIRDFEFKVINFQVSNCIFINSIIFVIKTLSKVVSRQAMSFSTINVYESSFFNSSLIETISETDYFQGQISFKLANMIFHRTELKSSKLISSKSILSKVESIFVNELILFNSILFDFELFDFADLTVTKNIITESCLIKSHSFSASSFQSKIIGMSIKFNRYTNGKAFIDFQHPNSLLIISRFVMAGNSKIFESTQTAQLIVTSTSLIYIHAKEVKLQKVTIIRGQGYPEISILHAKQSVFDDFQVTLDQQYQIEMIYPQFECIKETLIEEKYASLLIVFAGQNILIQNFYVNGLNSVNQPLIFIKSQEQFIEAQNESIIIKNSSFLANTLITTKLGVNLGAILIFSQQMQSIKIESVQFYKNKVNSYLQDITSKSASTLFIVSPLSTVTFQYLDLKRCIITNNMGSNLIVRARYLDVSYSTFQFLNIYKATYAEIYTRGSWGAENTQIYEESLRDAFPIKSQGGAAFFNVETLNIVDSTIQRSNGAFGGGFFVDLKDRGVVSIVKSQFYETQGSLGPVDESFGGALYVNSIAASLKFSMKQCGFDSTFSRKAGGGLYLVPSKESNIILIENCKIINSYSISGSFMFMTATESYNPDQVSLSIKDNILSNHEISTFIGSLVDLNENELELFKQAYVFDLNGGNVSFIRNRIAAVQLTGLLQCKNFYEIHIEHLNVLNQKLLSQSLLKLIPYKDNTGKIIFASIVLANISVFNFMHQKIDPPKKLDKTHFYCQKPRDLQSTITNFYDQVYLIQNFKYNMNKLLENYKGISSIVIVQNMTPSWYMDASHLSFEDIQCQTCMQGLFSITIGDLSEGRNLIRISEAIFRNNQCGLDGCIFVQGTFKGTLRNLRSELQQIYAHQESLELRNSLFYQNSAQNGAGLYLKTVDALIIRTRFTNNHAQCAGGAIYFIRSTQNNETLKLVETEFADNNASSGGALYISDYNLNDPKVLQIVFYRNQAGNFGDNLVQPPFSLTVSLNKGVSLLNVLQVTNDSKARIDQVLIPKDIKSQILFPSGQVLNQYKYYNSSAKNYQNANLSLRVIPLNNQGQRMQNLSNTSCFLDSRIISLSQANEPGAFTNSFTNMRAIPFNQTTQDYNLDSLIVKFSPQFRNSKVLQLRFQCNSIRIPIFDNDPPYLLREYAMNYSLLMNVQTFYCQQGEYLRVDNGMSLCEVCDSSQDYFSVQPGEVCRIKDQQTMINITSSQIQLREGFWRPSEQSILIENCRNFKSNCLGGWEPGQRSCFEGHIGALCEQCDLYDSRGDGPYSRSNTYKCGSCNAVGDNVTKLALVSLWTMISIMMSVNSTLDANLIAALGNKFKKIGIQVNPRIGISGILIKVFTNYMQILSTIATFQLQLPSFLASSLTSVGSPLEAMSYSLDCSLVDVAKAANIEVIYFRVIWGFLMPLFYIFAFLIIQGSLVRFKFAKQNLGVLSTSFVFMYVYLQPTIIGGLASLVSFRKISGILWIQGNVAYRYNTQSHQQWLFFCLVPCLLVFTLFIPLFMLYELYRRREHLDEFNVRQAWGYLFNEYKNKSFFWEIVKIYQKSLIIIFVIYYEDVIVIKGTLIFITVFIYSLLSKLITPYRIGFLNQFDGDSSLVCEFSIVMGISIYAATITNNQEVIWPFYGALIAFNGVFIIRIIAELLKAQIGENQEALDKIRDKIIDKFPSLKSFRFLYLNFLQNRQQQRLRVLARFQELRRVLKPIACYNRELIQKQELAHALSLKNRSQIDNECQSKKISENEPKLTIAEAKQPQFGQFELPMQNFDGQSEEDILTSPQPGLCEPIQQNKSKPQKVTPQFRRDRSNSSQRPSFRESEQSLIQVSVQKRNLPNYTLFSELQFQADSERLNSKLQESPISNSIVTNKLSNQKAYES